jgi:hypothetical protein
MVYAHGFRVIDMLKTAGIVAHPCGLSRPWCAHQHGYQLISHNVAMVIVLHTVH